MCGTSVPLIPAHWTTVLRDTINVNNNYLPWWRRILRRLQAESIPWPGCFFYNAVSTSGIFQKHYELTAKDIIKYCTHGKILDIGTGPGWLLLKLYHLSERLELTGLDISADMIKKARKNIAAATASANILLEVGSVETLPYPDHSFDMVVSTQSLHHWKNPVQSFNEINRVLKTGGHARIYDIVTDIPSEVFRTSAREYGRLKLLMLWIHACEEPFYSRQATFDLASSSLFQKGDLEFVGVLCCLDMVKK
jgi:ubiquinone/menaquinone biosynthesis C-methylase UbiE